MRKLLTWVVVTLGIAALVRKLRQRRGHPGPVPGISPPPAPPSAEPADQPEGEAPAGADAGGADPAQELRQKLAASRAEEPSPPASEPGSAEAPDSVESRRAEVHEQGRAALEDMQPGEES